MTRRRAARWPAGMGEAFAFMVIRSNGAPALPGDIVECAGPDPLRPGGLLAFWHGHWHEQAWYYGHGDLRPLTPAARDMLALVKR